MRVEQSIWFDAFRSELEAWAVRSPLVDGLLIVGSYGRGVPRADSDIDVMIISQRPEELLTRNDWLQLFGHPERVKQETWGVVQSLRVQYLCGPEVEFTVGSPQWVALPLDDGTRKVLHGGALLIYDGLGGAVLEALRSSQVSHA